MQKKVNKALCFTCLTQLFISVEEIPSFFQVQQHSSFTEWQSDESSSTNSIWESAFKDKQRVTVVVKKTLSVWYKI